MGDEIVKAHAGTDYHGNLVQAHIDILYHIYRRMEDRAREIGKEQVAALAYVEKRLGELVEVQTLKLLDGLVFDKAPAGHLHTEGVVGAEVVSEFYLHCCSPPLNVDSRKSSSIWTASICEGESIITSRPWLFLGKAM